MLRIIQGSLSSTAHEGIKGELKKLVNEGKRAYLLVPEQETVIAEKEMADFLPANAPLYFEVTNFTRFANSVFRSLGGIAGEYVDKAGSALLMWKVLEELSPMLSITEKSKEINTGTVEKLLCAVKEMNSLSIGAEELFTASRSEALLSNARLKTKLTDLSSVMTAYKAAMAGVFLDSDDDLAFVTKAVRENGKFFEDVTFFIEGFTSFTAPQGSLISELARRSNLTVILNLPKSEEGCFEYTEIALTKEKLIRAAKSNGAEISIIHEKEDPSKSSVIQTVASLLWKSGEKLDTPTPVSDEIRIFSASDPYEECDFLLSDIKRRVMEGAHFSDFAVVFRSAEDYSGIIEAGASKIGVPIFISRNRDLSGFEPVKLIYSALATIGSDFAREDVITYAKCALSGKDRDACDEFELYTECWRINGRRFYDGIAWNMNPDGYTDRTSESNKRKLVRINETREKIIAPLISLGEDIKAATTVREFAEALILFLTKIDLEGRIARRTEELIAFGEDEAAEENSKLWRIICAALDKLVRVLGDSVTDRRAFESQLKTVISTADIGRIPAYSDSVTVGSADMVRLRNKKHIYIAGVNLGEFPRAIKESSYFTDRDKLTLSSLGIPVSNDRAEVRCARELYVFTRTFASARESVTILYSERNKELSASHPSETIARIVEITNEGVKPCKISSLPLDKRIYSFDTALEGIDALPSYEKAAISESLSNLGFSDILKISERSITNDALSLTDRSLPLVYGSEEMSLTQSIIDRYVSCPFSHFLRYTLNLSENNEASFNFRNIGNFIHAVLEKFFGALTESNGSITELTENQKEELVRSAARSYVESVCQDSSARTGRMEMLVNRLCISTIPIIEDMCDEMKNCKFTPRFFELPISKFKKEGYPSPCEFTAEGHRLFIYGNIDRVDTYKSGKNVYVRVIDYKTGNKVFKREDIAEGKNLQMFLYLKSIIDTDDEEFLKKIGVDEDGTLIPAGVIYVKNNLSTDIFPTEDPETAMTSAKKKQERRGMILNDIISLDAMSEKHSPVKFKKDGTPDVRYEKYLYSEDDWDEMCEAMSDVLKDVTKRMTSGVISGTPDKSSDPCSYCRYKVICRKRII